MVASGFGAQLREDLATFRERVPRGGYPRELRERAVAYVADRSRNGAGPAEIVAELGVHEETARRWLDMADAASPQTTAAAAGGPALSLVPVVIGGQRLGAGSPRLKIELADGTRVHVSGLAVSDVVEAIQALRRSR